MTSTISALTQNTPSFDWGIISNSPFIQYILSPIVVFAILGLIVVRVFKLGEFKEKISKTLDEVKDLDKDVKKLLSYVDIIRTHLVTKGGLDANLFASTSPLKLLEKGIKLLEDSGFKKIYKDNKNWLIDEVEKYGVKTLADIDEASSKVMEKYRDNNKLANFKEIAIQNGVSLDVLLRVFAIYLRDEAAKELLNKKETKRQKT